MSSFERRALARVVTVMAAGQPPALMDYVAVRAWQIRRNQWRLDRLTTAGCRLVWFLVGVTFCAGTYLRVFGL